MHAAAGTAKGLGRRVGLEDFCCRILASTADKADMAVYSVGGTAVTSRTEDAFSELFGNLSRRWKF